MSEFKYNNIEVQPDVLHQFIDGEAVLLDLQSESYFGLNEVGSRIWELLREGHTLDSIHEILSREYDVEPEALQADMEQLITDLLAANLVRVVE